MAQHILKDILNARHQGRKQLAVLIDPDTPSPAQLKEIVEKAEAAGATLLFVGGSLLTRDVLDECIGQIKSLSSLPVVLFPGSVQQVSSQADAILFLSLISGRNPELLIGNHVIAAPYIRQAQLEVLPTGYMLVDSGRATTATYISGTPPIPHDKDEIAACTALAGEMLGLKLIYLDGGSGAEKPISPAMVKAVREAVDAPIIVGGGIRTAKQATELCRAGADIVVVGNATEKNPAVITDIAEAVKQTSIDAHLN